MTEESVKNMDAIIILSIINTKLRDKYVSLDSLCYDLEITKENVLNKLKTIGYNYNEIENQFKQF